MQALRDSGWTIEVDPKAGLTSHDATDFFPVIESDTDHGIDWFRFDITFELQGKQVSLIPIIAQAIRMDLPAADSPDLPEFLSVPCEDPEDGFIRFPAVRLIEMVDQVRHLFHGNTGDGPIRIDRIAAAGVADGLAIDSSETTRALAKLGHNLRNITDLPPAKLPTSLRAELRPYQLEGYRWLQFLAAHGLHGMLADDMGLGKTVQTLAHLAAECAKSPGLPSLVIAPTSVVPNWTAESREIHPASQGAHPSGQGPRRRIQRDRRGRHRAHLLSAARPRFRRAGQPKLARHRARRGAIHQESQIHQHAERLPAQGRPPPLSVRHADGKPPRRALEPHALPHARVSGRRKILQHAPSAAPSSATAPATPSLR